MGAAAEAVGLDQGVVEVFVAVAAMLLIGTLTRAVRLRRSGAGVDDVRRWRSVVTWWALFVLLVIVVVLGRDAVALVTAALSLLLLREALPLANVASGDRLAALGVVLFYLWAWLDWTSLYLAVLPLSIGAWLLVELAGGIGSGGGLGPRRAAGRALLLAVVGPSYALGVASLPPPTGRPDAAMAALVLLVVLTELNDSAQAWWGRNFGARPIAPRVSPRKTWAGLAGGVATTMIAAVLLAPRLSGYGRVEPVGVGVAGLDAFPLRAWPVLLGLVLGLAGAGGDLAASALKRRAGVKDSGTLLPGHGGLLDRLDSLALTAPVYFYLTWWLFHAGG